MGDRVCVLNVGILQQVATPLSLYDKPANVFVAGFIGSPAMNIGTFRLSDGHATLGDVPIPLSRATLDAVASEGSDQVILGFRPESLEPAPEGSAGAFPVVVDVVEELGSDAYLYGAAVGAAAEDTAAELASSSIIARVEPRNEPQKGETVYLKIRAGGEHCFSVKTGERLPS
jgi:multiple sugar transport system ATP-binding protein